MDQSQHDVLVDLEPLVQELIRKHEEKTTLWYSSDILPASSHEFLQGTAEANDKKRIELRDRARDLRDPVKVALVLNLITEEGLPHYHRIIAAGLGERTVWGAWNGLWTAEEDRHGNILRDYMRDAAVVDFRAVERDQFSFIRSGFHPAWNADAYKLITYTTLQEKATQISHLNTGRIANEPTLRHILDNIAQDESRHYAFYYSVGAGIIERDPNHFLTAALAILPNLEMPGTSAPHFREYAEIARKAGIYGPMQYKKAVEDILSGWDVPALTGLDAEGRHAQESLMAIPQNVLRYAQILEVRSKRKSYTLPILNNQASAM